MNSLLPSPALIDLALWCDLHLIIVLQVTASVPESFVEIGVWGGKKKPNNKRTDKCPDGKKGSSVCMYMCVCIGHVCQPSQHRECSVQWKLQLGIEKLMRWKVIGRLNFLTPLFVELQFSFGLCLPPFTSLSCFLGYRRIQAN